MVVLVLGLVAGESLHQQDFTTNTTSPDTVSLAANRRMLMNDSVC